MSPGLRDRASALVRFADRVAGDMGGARAVDAGRRRRRPCSRAACQRIASGKCSPTVTLDQPATIVNPALLQLTVSPTASTYTAATTDMDQASGLAAFTPVSLSVQANRAWTIQVQRQLGVLDGQRRCVDRQAGERFDLESHAGGADNRDVDDATDADDRIARPRFTERVGLHTSDRALGDRQAGLLLDDGDVHDDDTIERLDGSTAGQRQKKGEPRAAPLSVSGSEFCYGTWMLTIRVGQLPTLGSGFAHTLNCTTSPDLSGATAA